MPRAGVRTANNGLASTTISLGVLDVPQAAEIPRSVVVDTRQGVAVEYITRKAG